MAAAIFLAEPEQQSWDIIRSRPTVGMVSGYSPCPVSYTHLDVYKRQDVPSANKVVISGPDKQKVGQFCLLYTSTSSPASATTRRRLPAVIPRRLPPVTNKERSA